MGLENPLHILIVLAVVLLLFGARRLPEMGRSLGTGIREFKEGVTGPDRRALPSASSGSQSDQPRDHAEF